MKKYTAADVRIMLQDFMEVSRDKPLSQREFASKIGVSVPFLNSTLRGWREPQGKILDFLGLRRVVSYEPIKRRKKSASNQKGDL